MEQPALRLRDEVGRPCLAQQDDCQTEQPGAQQQQRSRLRSNGKFSVSEIPVAFSPPIRAGSAFLPQVELHAVKTEQQSIDVEHVAIALPKEEQIVIGEVSRRG